MRPLFCFIALLLAACDRSPPPAAPARAAKPAPWPRLSPAEVQLDQARLDAFSAAVGGNGVVIRRDALVHSWGLPHKPLDVASASKPVMAHFVFKAIEAGKIGSLDEPVVRWRPALTGKNARITWRQLISQTSCYGVSEEPGTAFDYNDYQTELLRDLIYTAVPGCSLEQATEHVLRPQLCDLIGAENKPYLRITEGDDVTGRLIISAADFARFGSVYLHGGKWQGKAVIAAEHIGTALSSFVTVPRTRGQPAEMLPDQRSYGGGANQEEHLGCYTGMWWLNVEKRLWPSVPADAFAAVGNGGLKVMMVIPSLEMIVSWNSAKLSPQPLYLEGKAQMDRLLTLLMAARTEG